MIDLRLAMEGTRGMRTRVAPRFSASKPHVIAITFLIFLQFGLVTIFTSQDAVLGQQIASIFIILSIFFFPFLRRRNFTLSRLSDAFPIILLGLCTLVSFISNNFIFGYGWSNWITYSYVMCPILAYYLFWAFSVSAADILAAIILGGLIAASIVALDSVFHFSTLDIIQRYTNVDTGTRRVPILKNEVVFALCLLLCDLYSRLNWTKKAPLYILGAPMMFYVVAFCFESRIALGAMLVSIFIFLCLRKVNSTSHIIYLFVILTGGIPTLYFGLNSYIEPILNERIGDYIANHNVEIRLLSNEYFFDYFLQTRGIGFGLMTLNLDVRNFQSEGIPRSFAVADLGIPAALYQFGVFGLMLVLLASMVLIVTFYRLGSRSLHPLRDRLLMTGCFTLGFILQPIPMNFFTLNWTVMLGACLWYLMRRASWEAVQLRSLALRAPHMDMGLSASESCYFDER